ncbi:PAS domain S-box protein [Methanoculleus sp. FWC-SCC1]|uniref:histidine kinase n=1 Tax=Methanoculleus frigidifontis TaxID=2584085 RepID=A0ABT8M5X2_9EURY|nr:PAS domain S-box protein [Methanoculleus sp. FWC-SCC1]MDN7023300.1 PAS domain S-box protein [Methanoculleus sp. FWC-SCC1]
MHASGDHLKGLLEEAKRRHDPRLLDEIAAGIDALAGQNRDLADEAARFNAAFAATGEWVIVYGADGRVLETSPAVIDGLARKSLTGLTAQEVAEKFALRRADGRPVEADELPESRALGGEIVKGIRLAATDREGRTLFVIASAVPIAGRQGRSGAIVVWQDVTHREEDRRRLEEANTLLEGIFNALGDIVGVQLPDRTIIRYNRIGYEMLGKNPDEVRGKKCYELIGRTTPCTACATEIAIRSKRPATVEKYVPELGMHLECRSSPVTDEQGKIAFIIEHLHDVTDRQQAVEALRRSEQRLSTLLSNLLGMAYRCRNDRSWTMEFLSDAVVAITGYAPEDLVENRRVAYADLIHPDDRDKVWQEVQAALAEQKPFQTIYRLTTRAGDEKWVWEQGRGIIGADGEIAAIEGYITDITQRVHAEQRLAESEERYRTIFTTSHAAMLIIDPETGDIVDANPAASGYYGYPHGVLTAMKITEINTLTPEETFAEVQKARTGQKRHFVLRHRLADGELRDVDVYSGVVVIHGRRLLHSIIHDVTDRRKAEEALQESEKRFRSIFEESPIAIGSYNAEGHFVDINPAGLRIFGVLDKQELERFNLFSDPNLPEAERHRLKQGETVHYIAEFDFDRIREHNLYRTSRSGTRHFDVLITRMISGDGRIPHSYVVLVQDITERVSAIHRIEQNMEQFAILGDHVRHPLQVILARADLMEDQETAEKLREQVRRINALIRELDAGWVESRKIREFLRRNELA